MTSAVTFQDLCRAFDEANAQPQFQVNGEPDAAALEKHLGYIEKFSAYLIEQGEVTKEHQASLQSLWGKRAKLMRLQAQMERLGPNNPDQAEIASDLKMATFFEKLSSFPQAVDFELIGMATTDKREIDAMLSQSMAEDTPQEAALYKPVLLAAKKAHDVVAALCASLSNRDEAEAKAKFKEYLAIQAEALPHQHAFYNHISKSLESALMFMGDLNSSASQISY